MKNTSHNDLTLQNTVLKEEVDRLNDVIATLEMELETYRNTSGGDSDDTMNTCYDDGSETELHY